MERCSQHGEDEPPWMCHCTRRCVLEAIHVLEMPRENMMDKAVDASVALTWLRRVIPDLPNAPRQFRSEAT